MEEGAKRRLVGAAVIVLLLVIFLPMLVEEDAQEPVPEADLSIPPEPAFDRDFDASISKGPQESVARPVPRELPPPALYEGPSGPDSVATLDADREEASEPEHGEHSASEQAPAPEVVEETKAKTEPPSAPRPTPTGVSSWVIQVASLSEQKRAKGLERELRGKGFPAFIEQAEVGGKTFHRVRVGPEIDRKRIEKVAKSLKAQTGLKVQIQRYP